MNKLIIFLSLVAGCFAHGHYHEIREKWDHFLRMTNKRYDHWEAQRRFDIFTHNVHIIDDHNYRFRQGLETFEMGIGPFADQTENEFMMMFDTHHGPYRSSVENIGKSPLLANRSYPEPNQVDYRNHMQPVKDQRNCKSGWAFAAVGAVEGMASLRLRWGISLSEQNVLDCAYGGEYMSYGCDGGSIWGALSYMRKYGVDTSQNYPYRAILSRCTMPISPAVRVANFYRIEDPDRELKRIVGNFGPVVTTIRVSPTMMHYQRGIIFDSHCGYGGTNHAVTIAGYGMEAGYQYWLLRNSWGPNWGERGYFRVARSYRNDCQIGELAYLADFD